MRAPLAQGATTPYHPGFNAVLVVAEDPSDDRWDAPAEKWNWSYFQARFRPISQQTAEALYLAGHCFWHTHMALHLPTIAR
jgi:hypothetical protein